MSIDHCRACASYIIQDPSDETCSRECRNGFYLENDKCVKCIENCSLYHSSVVCRQFDEESYSIMSDEQLICLSGIPQGYFATNNTLS